MCSCLLAADTNYRGGGPIARPLIGRNADFYAVANLWPLERLPERWYSAMRHEHIASHRKLFSRVALDLVGPPTGNLLDPYNVPTDERLAAVKKGADDPGLCALYFQYGRYLLMSCSRPFGLPANLQGM